ncbi:MULTISPECIES: PhzF family phenazine biosynthesis protein [Cyanophyceae]|uniref:PhzF family phenazine biosynthesis protein n=1 Tax=Cyanophyceae TaxID=3028117 RepID=UPI00232C5058|nr:MULTISPECIES: PhzF family phenazine biosynthesis protein [Cyanophyceae]MDB9357440.1 PhzF family phenazine biosynthesis protein [Nodularia spumigena CS-587/03]MDB9303549.1 PhzF family phenazine biosynthesis protein [Nodularia spumigena CS-591/12]MDB9317369.1 PhzF family phenazine biosynthesis protein [Nodularia spumigena CS-590/01A]MDB9328884.1 PhzF family phenazine biosynthesis protein [Nodularia spumigena CS-590/02]MDB9337418.1 PhzF family phenazine biosynthesis protein [Nodularia spumigen
MGLVIFQVDAFTNRCFAGNPAAVCVLSEFRDDAWMQSLAQEMNLSETAFLLRQDDGFSLRWFTPTVEVPLCGHATLASAHVLWSEGYLLPDEVARFYTKSGVLIAECLGEWISLDFPVNLSQETVAPAELSEALGVCCKSVLQNSLGYLVEVESEDLVRQMQPNFQLLKTLSIPDVIVTSQSHPDSEYDFVSRFFAPGLGINEDPVTGAAHCCLAAFWRDRLHKDEFLAFQASRRGGVVKVSYSGGDRVLLSGQAITVIRGELCS